MKSIITILFLTLYSFNFCQVLLGTFKTEPDYSTISITFLDESRFEYLTHGCMNYQFGTGNYKLTQKKLKLTFDSTANPNPSLISSKVISCANSDSVKIHLEIFNLKDSTETPAAFITLNKSSLKGLPLIPIAPSNKDGKIEFSTEKNSSFNWLHILSNDFRQEYSFKINTEICQNISIYLQKETPPSFIHSGIIKYNIRLNSENQFEILYKEDGITLILNKTKL